jgi:NADH-quinone oxidoreductase subunit A
MLIEYLAIGVMILLTALIAVIAIVLGSLFGPKRETDRKAMPYESGMRPVGPGTRRVPVRFYLIAVLFILFDIEVVFFIPWAVVFRELSLYGFIAMLIFNIPILIGFIYEWKEGGLEWE